MVQDMLKNNNGLKYRYFNMIISIIFIGTTYSILYLSLKIKPFPLINNILILDLRTNIAYNIETILYQGEKNEDFSTNEYTIYGILWRERPKCS